MTYSEAATLARRKARYGHRDWIVWRDKAGECHAERATSAAIKQALLAMGTQGTFTSYDASNGHGCLWHWRSGINYMQNLAYFERTTP